MNIKQNKAIALFVGAGAIENAWLPIIRALQPEYFIHELSNEAATSGLTRLVHLLRWYSNNPTETLEKLKQILKNTKEQICEQIHIAQENSELKIRDTFWKILDQITISNPYRLLVVSTNWDTVADDAINSYNPIKLLFNNNDRILVAHIHGIYNDPTNIYLPSEAIEEPYRADIERKFLGAMHSSAMQHLINAEVLILYGLSVSPLDAELIQMIGGCLSSNNIKCIKIVNPDHSSVAEKLNLVLQYPTEIQVEGYDPDNIQVACNYTLY